MTNGLKITKLEVHAYRYEVTDCGKDPISFNVVHAPGSRLAHTRYAFRVLTDAGPIG
jgi:hypothetical protein